MAKLKKGDIVTTNLKDLTTHKGSIGGTHLKTAKKILKGGGKFKVVFINDEPERFSGDVQTVGVVDINKPGDAAIEIPSSILVKESKLNENDIRTLIRTMIEQELDQFDIEDEEKDKCDIGECGTECSECETNETCDKDKKNEEDELEEVSSVTAMGGQDGYQTPYAFAKKLKDRTKEISQQLGYKLVNEPEDRDWEDLHNAQKESLVYRRKFAEMKVRSGLTEGWINYSKEYPGSEIPVGAKVKVTYGKHKGKMGKVHDEAPATGYAIVKVGGGVEYFNNADLLVRESIMNEEKYVVTAKVRGKNRDTISQPMDKKKADGFAQNLKNDMKIAIPKYKTFSDIKVEPLNEGRRGAYQDYRDDADTTPRQKIGVSLRDVRNQLESIEKTIDLNLRLKQETGIDTQQYWKNTHRALAKINEKMTRIINKVRRF